jgi:hypothetical protein
VDAGLIDAVLVNGVARGLRWLGGAGARLQPGQANTYAFAVVVGLIVILLLIVR